MSICPSSLINRDSFPRPAPFYGLKDNQRGHSNHVAQFNALVWQKHLLQKNTKQVLKTFVPCISLQGSQDADSRHFSAINFSAFDFPVVNVPEFRLQPWVAGKARARLIRGYTPRGWNSVRRAELRKPSGTSFLYRQANACRSPIVSLKAARSISHA